MRKVVAVVACVVVTGAASAGNLIEGVGAYAIGTGMQTGLPVENATVLGPLATSVDSEHSTAVGAEAAVVQSDGATAVGASSNIAASSSATAVGKDSVIDNSPAATVLGTSARSLDSENATVVGQSAIALRSTNSFVAGSAASATDASSSTVILGRAATSTQAVSVGSGSAVLTSDYSLAIGRNARALGTDFSVPGVNTDPTRYIGQVAIGNYALTGNGVSNATALGMNAQVYGPQDGTQWSIAPIVGGTSLGYSSGVIGLSPYSTAVGGNARVYNSARSTALGAYSVVSTGADDSVALGSYSRATTANTVSVGNATLQRVITNVAAGGASQYDAVNYGQFSALASTVSSLSSTVAALPSGGGGGSSVTTTSTTMAFSDGNANHDASVTVSSGQVQISAGDPNTLTVSATGIAAQLEAGSTATIRNAAGQGIAISDQGVQVNTALDMQGNRIQNVGDAVDQTDAVNLRTLQSALQPLDNRLTGVENRVGALEQRVDRVERVASGGIATALALAQPVAMGVGQKNAVTGGVGTYNGQSAVGFSYNRLVHDTPQKQVLVSAGVGVSTVSRPAARAGFSLSW